MYSSLCDPTAFHIVPAAVRGCVCVCKIPISVRVRDVQTMRYHRTEEGAFIESRSGEEALRGGEGSGLMVQRQEINGMFLVITIPSIDMLLGK